jgi:hypothetical protein
MILDACWKMAERLLVLKCKGHGDRIKVLCEEFNLVQFMRIVDIKELVRLRNDLFHETLWHDSRPGSTIGNLPYHIPTVMEEYLTKPLIIGLINRSLKQTV